MKAVRCGGLLASSFGKDFTLPRERLERFFGKKPRLPRRGSVEWENERAIVSHRVRYIFPSISLATSFARTRRERRRNTPRPRCALGLFTPDREARASNQSRAVVVDTYVRIYGETLREKKQAKVLTSVSRLVFARSRSRVVANGPRDTSGSSHAVKGNPNQRVGRIPSNRSRHRRRVIIAAGVLVE